MHALFPAVALGLGACAAQQGGEAVMPMEPSCTMTGGKYAGTEEADLCSLFAEQVRAVGREDIAAIELQALSATSAHVKAFDAKGDLVAELSFSVTDREMTASVWKTFASDFARYLKTLER